MDYETKSYDEMMAQAKAIHSDANVRLNHKNEWEIFIATNFGESYVADDSWKDSYAGEAFRTPDGNGDDVLSRWAGKNGYSGQPIALVAEQYNLNRESQLYGSKRMDEELLKAVNMTVDKMFAGRRVVTEEEFRLYENLRDTIGKEMTEVFKEKQDILNDKLGYTS